MWRNSKERMGDLFLTPDMHAMEEFRYLLSKYGRTSPHEPTTWRRSQIVAQTGSDDESDLYGELEAEIAEYAEGQEAECWIDTRYVDWFIGYLAEICAHSYLAEPFWILPSDGDLLVQWEPVEGVLIYPCLEVHLEDMRMVLFIERVNNDYETSDIEQVSFSHDLTPVQFADKLAEVLHEKLVKAHGRKAY